MSGSIGGTISELQKEESLNELLLQAASNGEFKDVEKLIKMGADIDTQGKHGYTPLSNAIEALGFGSEGKYPDIVKYLVEEGANIETKNMFGETALHMGTCNSKIVEYLIHKKANIEARDNNGRTPIISGVINMNVKAVQCLIDNNANLDATDKNGKSLIMFARDAKNIYRDTLFKLLRDQGCKLD